MRKITILLVTLALVAGMLPLAQAGWKLRGTNEPDTVYDVTDNMMFLEPDTEKDGHKVYFNAWGRVARFTQYNPNVAATGSTMGPPVQTTFTAFLGIWKDCNKDGYVGSSEYGLFEYRAELLLDDSVCGKQTVAGGQNCGTPNRPACPDPYPHNDGAWIREFIFIGPNLGGKGNPNDNPTIFLADETRIWGDWNLPGDEPRTVCPLGGNLDARTTGGMLDWADCIAGYTIMPTLNQVEDDTGLPVGGWDVADPGNSQNTLNQDNPVYALLYGKDDHGGLLGHDDPENNREAPQAYRAWDCSSGEAEPDVTTDVAPTASWYETANESYTVLTQGECKSQGDGLYGTAYPRISGSGDAQERNRGKREVDHSFKFSFGNRKLLNGLGPLGPFAPADLGTAVERDDGPVGPAWRSNAGISRTPQLINRDVDEAGPAPAEYMTFYAKLGPRVQTTGFEVPAAAQNAKLYGSDACGTNIGPGQPVLNGWNCDPQAWYDFCGQRDPPTLPSECQVVGDPYHMRDIDCWDGRVVRGMPVFVSTVFIHNDGPCAQHADHQAPIS